MLHVASRNFLFRIHYWRFWLAFQSAQLMTNAGLNAQALLAQVQAGKAGFGVNVNDDDSALVDMKKVGVVDPARVTKEAIMNAASIAGTAMTMGALIVDIPEKEAPSSPGGGMDPSLMGM